MASVTFDAVTKRYGSVTAVDDLNLAIADGEFMVLLGPSGCGKTTALRMIAGLEDITEGKLSIGDEVVNDVDPSRRDISMVFQSYALYPHMTVRKNIESPLRVRSYHVDGPDAPARKLTTAERDERVAEAARVLGLEDYLDRKPSALSGGQRQRVALARAFVGRPQAFLMDEPLSNLDAKLRAQTRIELVELHKRVGTTVVYVTHDQIEAMTMATRVAIMSMGELQQVGTPQEVYDKPINTFVAQFIGTPPMNCFAGKVAADGGNVAVAGGTLPMPPGLASPPAGGTEVIVGVRPEHLAADPNGTLQVDVRAVEWLGHECLISASIGEEALVIREVGLSQNHAGSTMHLSVDPANVHLFDPTTTERFT
ncbi:MAG: sn-glycerol-3-phosphate ABC transporter ATP-binding protein UgpC [Acidimicrobiales bacterium]|nr:sn-glycerol-3-phosphate ABC transporter ATP-binding protein UgpC [Acidimicrobiales bacterium]